MKKPIIVLKFGGSVLTTEEAVVQAVAEIYRYVRQGFGVVAVVSALKGVTDHLIGVARHYGATAHDHAARYLLATGEYRSAALLSLACGRVGLSTAILQPHEIGLVARGEPDDAAPTHVDADRIHVSLKDHDVVILPGFVALDPRGQTILLGRGGTDLSAIFIAIRLGNTRLRLLKDVDAVFDRDPVKSGGSARAYSALSWSQALQVAHPLVQRKAVQLASDNRLEIEVAALGRGYETIIGTSTEVRKADTARSPARVAILGCGVVGGGVVERLIEEADSFDITAILVRNLVERAHLPYRSLFTDDPASLLDSQPDIFLDVGSGSEPSRSLITEFLRRKVAVVSANKQAAVSHEAAHADAPEHANPAFLYSAAVGGGAPFLEAVARSRRRIRRIAGVLNGTTNYVLDRCRFVPSVEAAVREAQHAGFAEADPSADLSGRDAAAKIRLISLAAWGRLPSELAKCEPLTGEALEHGASGVLKQVARCSVGETGEAVCDVRLERLPTDHFLAGARAEENRLEIELLDGEFVQVAGKGAGRFPTTEAVMADLFETFRNLTNASADAYGLPA